MFSRFRTLSLVLAGAAALTLGLLVATEPSTGSAATRADAGTSGAPHVDVDDVLGHLEQLQSIADASGGNRSAGTDGYAASVDYVADTLSAAGFEVERQTCKDCPYRQDQNVIADWPGGDTDSTVLFGAHLDSVSRGPGINDDGSGSAALLQIALTLARTDPDMARHVRFGWWASEEQDIDGSNYYVDTKGTDDLEAYVNLDMVASPNAGYFLTYPDSTYAAPIVGYLDSVGRTPEKMDGHCRCSDDQPFTQAGVPTVYLATGDVDKMTEKEAQEWGGTAGEAFDPCYHQACDSYPDNINTAALDYTTNATATALWDLAVQPQAGGTPGRAAPR